jgi:hypothetical protein
LRMADHRNRPGEAERATEFVTAKGPSFHEATMRSWTGD